MQITHSTSDGRSLYYYGSLPTLVSMLSSKQIWLSDIRKSNDSDEVAYGMRQIKHRLDAVLESIGRGRREFSIPADYLLDEGFDAPIGMVDFCEHGRELAQGLRNIYSHMGQRRDMLYAHFAARRCFALCFTGNGDLLSQWRGYGDNARGVAIGFSKASVLRYVRAHAKDAIPGTTLQFCPVYYREQDDELHQFQKDELRETPFLARRFEVTRGHLFREDEIGQIDRLLYKMVRDLCHGGLRDDKGDVDLVQVARCCENLAPLLKQPSFCEKREERLFCWKDPTSNGPSVPSDAGAGAAGKQAHRLRATTRADGKLALHIELPIIATEADCGAGQVRINRIVLGTRCVADRQDMRALLSEHGFDSSTIEIIDSNTTYVG